MRQSEFGRILARLVVNALALAAAIWIVGGITLEGASTSNTIVTLVVVAAIFGLINAIIKPVIKLLALPLFILTLGLITVVINGLMLWLTSGIAGLLDIPFHVEGFWSSVWGAIIVSIVSLALNLLLPEDEPSRS